jgi:hypothetical protein
VAALWAVHFGGENCSCYQLPREAPEFCTPAIEVGWETGHHHLR